MTENILFHFEHRLVEESVFFAQRSGRLAGDFRRQRDEIFEVADVEQREVLFQKLYQTWFVRLGLGQPIEKAFYEQPLIGSQVNGCVVGRTARTADEGAELFVRAGQDSGDARRRTVRILLRPESLLSPDTLLTFLRHELFHIADMVDPAFSYEPALPPSAVGPSYDSLLRDRYRAVWDATIDGRMLRRGWLASSTRIRCLAEFAVAFPMLGDRTERIFAAFFDQEPHKHAQFVAFAQDPRATWDKAAAGPQPGSRCALCGFPTYAFVRKPEHLDSLTLSEILRDFPEWQAAGGLCTQCADLYRARSDSLKAANQLPGCLAS